SDFSAFGFYVAKVCRLNEASNFPKQFLACETCETEAGICSVLRPTAHQDISLKENGPLPEHRQNPAGHLLSPPVTLGKALDRPSECSWLPKERTDLKRLCRQRRRSICVLDGYATFGATLKRAVPFPVLWKVL